MSNEPYTDGQMEYLEHLGDEEGLETMPTPIKHKPMPRNDNDAYRNYIKTIATGIGLHKVIPKPASVTPIRNPYANNSTPFPKQYNDDCSHPDYDPFANNYSHPDYKYMSCAKGFNPGPPRPSRASINPLPTSSPPNQFSQLTMQQETKPSSQPYSQHTPWAQQTQGTQATTMTSPQQEQERRMSMLEDSTSSSNHSARSTASRKRPPNPYPFEIVDQFNEALVKTATDNLFCNNADDIFTRSTEYQGNYQINTTTFMYRPITRDELEDKLNITIAEPSNTGTSNRVFQFQPTERPIKRVCVRKTTWIGGSTVTHTINSFIPPP